MAKRSEKVKRPKIDITAQPKAKKKKPKDIKAKNVKTELPTVKQRQRKIKAKKAKQSNFIKHLIENNFNISRACKEIGVSRRIYYEWIQVDQEFKEQIDDVYESRIDEWEACLQKNIKAGSDASVIFALKTLGKVRGWVERETSNSKVIEILSRALSEEISPREAAYQITMLGLPLPEVLKIELSKIQPEPPPPDLPPSVSDEELETQYQKKMTEIKKQEETWVPERQEDVRQLKEELKDVESFGPDAENKVGDRGHQPE